MKTLQDFIHAHEANTLITAFDDLFDGFSFSAIANQLPSVEVIQMLMPTDFPFQFVSQERLPSDDDYERYIWRTKQIPTRFASWHDFFNGLIWLQFVRTKRCLNELHVQHIEQLGLHPRGAVRDRITHFDECGLCLYWYKDSPEDLLREHRWNDLFCTHASRWFTQWRPIIFGHALYEMLLTPFIGLTAKALLIESPIPVDQLNRQAADQLASEAIIHCQPFAQNKRLLPVPLLGVPGWHFAQQDASFYANQQYFRQATMK